MIIRENDQLAVPHHQRKDTCHACQAENVTTMPMQIKVETEQNGSRHVLLCNLCGKIQYDTETEQKQKERKQKAEAQRQAFLERYDPEYTGELPF